MYRNNNNNNNNKINSDFIIKLCYDTNKTCTDVFQLNKKNISVVVTTYSTLFYA